MYSAYLNKKIKSELFELSDCLLRKNKLAATTLKGNNISFLSTLSKAVSVRVSGHQTHTRANMARSSRARASGGGDREDVEPRRRRAQVVVLGDFGRSPRMQYHALSLASQANMDVDVVAYEGSTPRPELLNHPHISLRLVTPPPQWLQRFLPRLLAMAVRVLLQICQLTLTMAVRLPKPDFILLQTPPCMPSFTVCRLTAWLRRAKFIIDWHNFAYTLMALKHGPRHPVVRPARRGEEYDRTPEIPPSPKNQSNSFLQRQRR